MVRAFLQFVLLFLFLVILLTFESVVGLPVVFLSIVGLLSPILRQILWWPLLLLLFLSLVYSVVYNIPIAATLIMMLALVIFVAESKPWIEKKAVRLGIAVSAALVATLLLSPLQLANVGLFTFVLQVIIVSLLIWRAIAIPDATRRDTSILGK